MRKQRSRRELAQITQILVYLLDISFLYKRKNSVSTYRSYLRFDYVTVFISIGYLQGRSEYTECWRCDYNLPAQKFLSFSFAYKKSMYPTRTFRGPITIWPQYPSFQPKLLPETPASLLAKHLYNPHHFFGIIHHRDPWPLSPCHLRFTF